MRAISIASLVVTWLAPVVANAAEWRATFTLIAGNSSTCGQSSSSKYWVIEESGTLVVTNPTKRIRHLTIQLLPDGSAAGDFPLQLQRTEQVRAKGPAGSGPRVFEFLKLSNACTIRVDPV